MPSLRRPSYKPMKFTKGDRDVTYALPRHGYYAMTLDEPAISLMMDFRLLHAKKISQEAGLDEALEKMGSMNMRMLVVVDPSDGHVVGLVTAAYLHSADLTQLMQRKGLKRRDVHMSDIMIPKDQMYFVPYDDVRKSRVGDVLETLSKLDLPYIFVSHDEEGDHCVRGLFTAREIGLQLEVEVDAAASTPPRSFADLLGAIHKSRTRG